jgi:hypothetical protein
VSKKSGNLAKLNKGEIKVKMGSEITLFGTCVQQKISEKISVG